MNKFFSTAAVAVLAVCSLTACGASETASNPSAEASTSSASSSSALEVNNAWVKATTGSMTGVFGELKNTGDEPITIVSAKSAISDMNQLHTTEIDSSGTSMMKETESFEVEPGQTYTLEPGGDHIMLMGMQCSLPAGSEATITLTDSNGTSYDFTAEVRDYSGAKEEYAPGEEASVMNGHSHEGHSMPASLPECK